jgi:hypothetical protein
LVSSTGVFVSVTVELVSVTVGLATEEELLSSPPPQEIRTAETNKITSTFVFRIKSMMNLIYCNNVESTVNFTSNVLECKNRNSTIQPFSPSAHNQPGIEVIRGRR